MLTQSLFDPKSFEPNYKQTAVQLHSEKAPQGIKLAEEEIAGVLNYQKVLHNAGKKERAEKFSMLKNH